jgi:hypothetical protein
MQQPGGFFYNILPYIEESILHNLGKGLSLQDKPTALAQAGTTPIAEFICPSRRDVAAYAHQASFEGQSSTYFNMAGLSLIGKTDYAGNAGDQTSGDYYNGPPSLAIGDAELSTALTNPPAGVAATPPVVVLFQLPSDMHATGVSFVLSTVKLAYITDGTSNTILAGEKFMPPDGYSSGALEGDFQGWDVGYLDDIYRWGSPNQPLMQDTVGADFYECFGSAHFDTAGFVFCDGSVHRLSYSIDTRLLGNLCNRSDGQVIDSGAIQ